MKLDEIVEGKDNNIRMRVKKLDDWKKQIKNHFSKEDIKFVEKKKGVYAMNADEEWSDISFGEFNKAKDTGVVYDNHAMISAMDMI
jgi:ABC-type Zn uptake system ZnuABC Zn-binding protein ZnuA